MIILIPSRRYHLAIEQTRARHKQTNVYNRNFQDTPNSETGVFRDSNNSLNNGI